HGDQDRAPRRALARGGPRVQCPDARGWLEIGLLCRPGAGLDSEATGPDRLARVPPCRRGRGDGARRVRIEAAALADPRQTEGRPRRAGPVLGGCPRPEFRCPGPAPDPGDAQVAALAVQLGARRRRRADVADAAEDGLAAAPGAVLPAREQAVPL